MFDKKIFWDFLKIAKPFLTYSCQSFPKYPQEQNWYEIDFPPFWIRNMTCADAIRFLLSQGRWELNFTKFQHFNSINPEILEEGEQVTFIFLDEAFGLF